MKYVHIDALEVVKKFGYLIAGKGKFSGLEFAKNILKSNKDCLEYRVSCASSVACSVYEIELNDSTGKCMVKEIL